jgi:hypothetical protein
MSYLLQDVHDYDKRGNVMNYRTVSTLTVGICLLLLILASPRKGNDVIAGSVYDGLMDTGVNTLTTVVTTPGSTVQSETVSSWACLPQYSEPEHILNLNPPTDLWGMGSADFNDDGWPDAVLWRGFFQTGLAFELDVLLNNGSGSLVLGTSQVFSGTVPSVVEGRELVLADFNGDGRLDMFFADQGRDTPPHPGHQNTLVMSAPSGKLVDATGNLPQQSAMTHSAAAADIDGDEDVDLYVGNIWGQSDIDPQILINDGNGMFSVGKNRLPPLVDLNQNGYTTCEFVDVNNDCAADLVLGDAGDDIANEHSTRDSEVLLNDGTGHFSILTNAIPSKPFAETDIALDVDADDINGDGYEDLLIVFTKGDYVGRYIQVLINNQNGTFSDETSTRLPQSDNNDPWISWVFLLDLDMDGHLDIAAAPTGGQEPLFYLNNGNGIFRPLPNVFKIGVPWPFTFPDIDQDGFLDVLWSYPSCHDGTCPEQHFMVRALGCPVFLPSVCRNYPVGN